MQPTHPEAGDNVAGGWTGGQFSLLRIVLGLWLAVRSFALAFSGDALAGGLGALAVLLSAMVILGWRVRWGGLGLAIFNAVLAWRSVAADSTALAQLAMVLEPTAAIVLPGALAWAPAGPFGSAAARGRPDPAGDWRLPPAWAGTLTGLLAIAYLAGAIYLLTAPAWRLGTGLWQPGVATGGEVAGWMRAMTWAVLGGWLAFAGIALIGHLRPWVWLAALAVSAIGLSAAGWGWLAVALISWHLATFEPAWLGPTSLGQPERVFYDGHCGLCHRSVRLVLAEDQSGLFIISPLQGRTFERMIPADQRATLPDSIVVQRADQTLLVRSAAVWHILDRLGGLWRVVSWFGRAVPRPVGDAAYRGIAALRNRLFARPREVCPMMPSTLRDRFEM